VLKIPSSLFLSVILFFTGCKTTSEPQQIVLPLWIQSPPLDDDSSFYGIGSSYSVELAKTAALQDISAKLGISLIGQTRINEQMYRNQYTRYIDSNIKTTQDATLLSRYQILKTFTDKHQVYILIKVSKENVIEDNKLQLKQINMKAIKQGQRLNQVSSLKWNINTQQLITDNISKAMRYSIIINMLNEQQSIDNLMTPWSKLSNQQSSLKLCVNLKTIDQLSKQYMPVLESHLNNQNIILKPNCTTHLLVSSRVETNNIFDYYHFKNTLHFKLKTKKEGILVSESLVVNGKSVTSFDIAKNISVNNLKNILLKETIWEIIKI
jgi:hypothetical protein